MGLKDVIVDWMREQELKNHDSNVTQVAKAFGVFTFKNGRKAQIQIVLEMDEDDWFEDE